MQVRALQITQAEFIVLFFFAYDTAKRMQNKEDLLENNATEKCSKTGDCEVYVEFSIAL